MMRTALHLFSALGFLACAACSESGGARPTAAAPGSASAPAPANASSDPAAAPASRPGGVSNPTGLPGGDQDAHGCKPSAGYQWCAKETRCVRPWELASEKHLANSDAAVTTYCGT